MIVKRKQHDLRVGLVKSKCIIKKKLLQQANKSGIQLKLYIFLLSKRNWKKHCTKFSIFLFLNQLSHCV